MSARPIKPVPLDRETRETLSTAEAAFHLNRADQTLLQWSCLGTGPLKPIKIRGRLAWRVADIKRLLGMEG